MPFKKIILIVLFLAATVGFGYVLYRLFFAPAAAPTVVVTPGETTQPGQLPTAGIGRPSPGVSTAPGGLPTAAGLPTASPVARGGYTETKAVATVAVLAPKMTPSGNLNYYNQEDGRFYRLGPDGRPVALSDKTFPAAQNVEWSPQGAKAVIEFPDATKVIYDFDRQRQVTLPKHWEDFSFAADGEELAAKSIGLDPANRWLITFAADGSDAKLIEPLGENEDKVIVDYSPSGEVVGFSDTAEPVGFDTRDQLLIGKNGENFKALRIEGFGFIPSWSPDGQNLLYSAAGQGDSYMPTLWFSGGRGDAIGAGRTNLGVHTWADKCTFADSATVYCAVPDVLPEGAGLERAVARGVPDSIYKIDLTNGTKTAVGRPAADTSMKDLVVTPDGSRLYFTDELTGGLQEMLLK